MIEILATKDNQPYLVEFKTWKFPSGEIGVKLLDFEDVDFNNSSIQWDYIKDNDELMQLLQLVEAIRELQPEAQVDLVVPYLPYSRQDRVCHKGEANSMHIFLNIIINSFRNIYTLDVHNEDAFKSMTLAQQGINIPQAICASNLPKYNIFIAPDAGAAKKIYSHRQVCQENNPTKVITISKTRVDGKVVYDHLPRGTIPAGSKVCVVDDLADGGATFISIMEQAIDPFDYMESNFDLYVTHGIFTNKEKFITLKNIYGTIWTCNLMNTDPDTISQVKLIKEAHEN